MHAAIIVRKNLDGSLPASHTIDLRVTFDPGSAVKGAKDIAMPLMRRDDQPRADALTGVRVKISDNYFLVGLNRGAADVVRNVQELTERGAERDRSRQRVGPPSDCAQPGATSCPSNAFSARSDLQDDAINVWPEIAGTGPPTVDLRGGGLP